MTLFPYMTLFRSCYDVMATMKMSILGTVYMITNDVNDKDYVGSTTRHPSSRWRPSVMEASAKVAKSDTLAKDIERYGVDHFCITIIDAIMVKPDDLAALRTLEAHYQRLYHTLAPNGYNLMWADHSHKGNNRSKRHIARKKGDTSTANALRDRKSTRLNSSHAQ